VNCWKLLAAGGLALALFFALTLPSLPTGAVIGTGQDEWYNMMRALRALYEFFDPSYFIHPALYYEVLATAYGLARARLWISGAAGTPADFLAYVLAHQDRFLDLARYTSAAGGALAVLAAVALGAALSGASGGLLAGVVVASLPLLRELAGSIRVDTVAMATWLGSAALIVRHDRRGSRASLMLAAIGIGVAAAANYPGALLLLPLGWLEWIRPGADPASARARHIGAAAAIAFAVFLALNPYVVIDFRLFLRWFAFQADVAVATHPHADAPNAGRYFALLAEQGMPAVAACAAGALAALRPRAPGGALALLAAIDLLAFSLMQSQYDRFALPGIALLCVAGAAWLSAQVARVVPPAAAGAIPVALSLIVGAVASGEVRSAPLPVSQPSDDYRADMFEWISVNVPPTATLIFESDTLPLVQEAYDSGDQGGRFQPALRQAFEQLHPHRPARIIKAQLIAAIYNYDPSLLDGDEVFFLGSSQNRAYVADNRAQLADPAAFYDALDARAAVVHEATGGRERLVLYAVGAPRQ
jgi:hypothetical protein